MSVTSSSKDGLNTDDASSAYWRSLLENYTAPTPFVVDGTFTSAAADQVSTAGRAFTPEVAQKLDTFLDSSKLSADIFYISLWALLLHRYSSEQSVLFGITASGLLGTPAAVAPVSINISEHDAVSVWMNAVQQAISAVSDHDVPPMEQLHAFTGIPDDAPLIDSLLILDQAMDDGQSGRNGFPLTLLINTGSEAGLSIEYDVQRFSENAINRMLGHLTTMTESILDNPQEQVCDVKILTDAEYQQIIYDWNETSIDFPDKSCLHELFERRVTDDPDAIAAVFEDTSYTYGELNQRANQLARHLQQKGAGPNKLVAISLGRGLDMVVGLMGISKSGSAYVPLDPNYPRDRLAFMLEDTSAPILLTESALLEGLPEHTAKTVLIDQHWPEIAKQDSSNVSSDVTAEDLAYVIYTSGSTGRPKGRRGRC